MLAEGIDVDRFASKAPSDIIKWPNMGSNLVGRRRAKIIVATHSRGKEVFAVNKKRNGNNVTALT